MESKIHKFYPRWEDGITAARAFLNNSKKPMKILVEQNRNLGDTLHLTPIIRHYRIQYPEACIVFIVAQPYANAHEFNPDIDRLFLIPSLVPHKRIMMRRKLITFNECKIIAPSIFPYGEIWKELKWSFPNIAEQYFHNAGIPNRNPQGGKQLIVQTTPKDQEWADGFMKVNKLDGFKTCALEYHSYSDTPRWKGKHFKYFAEHLNTKYGIRCVSLCGKNERPIPGTISAAGISWRQTVALLERCGSFVGIGSGLTMLAASCSVEKQPKILEMLISDSITMKGCGYANSIKIGNPDPSIVADHLWHKVLH